MTRTGSTTSGMTRRHLVQRAAAGAATTLMAACAPGQSTPPPTTAGTAGEIVYWHIWGDVREPLMKAQLDAFAQKYPKIKVDASLMANNAQTGEKLTATLVSGSPLDVFMANTDFYHGLIATKTLAPLDDYLKRDKIASGDWYEALWRLVIWDGKSYGLPAVNSGPNVHFIHSSSYREVGLPAGQGPATWEDLREHSRKVTKSEPDAIRRLGWNVTNLGNHFFQFAHRNGVQVVSPDLKRLTFDGPAMLETVEYYVTFLQALYGTRQRVSDLMAQARQGVQASLPVPAFLRGSEIITTAGPFLISQIKEAAPEVEYFIAPVPQAPARIKSDPSFAMWSYTIATASKFKDASWELARFLSHAEGQRDFMLAQGRPSVVKKHNDDPAFKKDNPHWETITRILRETDGPGVPIPQLGPIRTELFARVGDAMDGALSPRDAIRQAQEGGQRHLDQFWNTYAR